MAMKLRELISESKRILRLARKPTKEEFTQMAKITGIGILFLGIVGFIIQLLFTLIRGGI